MQTLCDSTRRRGSSTHRSDRHDRRGETLCCNIYFMKISTVLHNRKERSACDSEIRIAEFGTDSCGISFACAPHEHSRDFSGWPPPTDQRNSHRTCKKVLVPWAQFCSIKYRKTKLASSHTNLLHLQVRQRQYHTGSRRGVDRFPSALAQPSLPLTRCRSVHTTPSLNNQHLPPKLLCTPKA